MRLTIGMRAFLALTAVSLATLALNAAVTRWNFERGFLGYIEEQEAATIATAAAALVELYAEEGSWASLQSHPRRLGAILRPQAGERRSRGVPGGSPPPPDPLDIKRRVSLLDADGSPVSGPRPAPDATRTTLEIDGKTIGFLSIAPRNALTDELDRRFVREQQHSILLAAAAALILAAAISALLARQLTKPIRALARGANAITAGDYRTRIERSGEDELGDLASDFNRLAETLENNRTARKRWIADIAHELRTPLAVLRGELEALEDGVRAFDAATQKSLGAEVSRLTKLVADLHDLSVYDDGSLDYQLVELDVCALLEASLETAATRLDAASIELTLKLPKSEIRVLADDERLEQVFSNLIENTIRYTDFPGHLRVSCGSTPDVAVIEFADSGPGVPERALEHIFDRLFRVETSRSREFGGSGLGLAICKAIVEAHGGSIRAAHSALGGLLVEIRLPLAGGNA